MKKRVLTVMLVSVMALCILGGCGVSNKKSDDILLPHYDELEKDKDYNRKLFYKNDLLTKAADPSVIYVTEGAEKGYFYMYATSDDIGASGYQSWRSKDSANWECTGVAFVPDRNCWARQNYWAPEVIYHKETGKTAGKYYMYYSAMNVNKDNLHSVGLAISDTPNGPFVQYTGVSGDRTITINDSFIDTSLFADSAIKNAPLIDASPFIDDDGKMYLYFVLDIQKGAENSSIWGVELADMHTPKYETVKQITEFGKKSVGGDAIKGDENRTNEAPFVIKKGNKYYMTYSTSQFDKPGYSVCQAIGSSPLGAFEKVDYENGGRFISYKGVKGEESYDHMSGTGHHSFAKVGDEIFAIYHAFVDRTAGTIALGRAIAADKVSFVNNGTDEILYCNGPSYSLQPLPSQITGYKNIAPLAAIAKPDNAIDGFGAEYLIDGIYKNHNYSFIKEFKASKGTTITMTFPKEVTARAIMIYNSFDYETAFKKIDKITFTNSKNNNYIINDLKFDDMHIFTDKNDPTYKLMRPGGASIAEFNDLKINKITITIKSSTPITISDIVVLGMEGV